MKKALMKNGIIILVSILVSVVLALAVGGFSWSFKRFSEMLAYSGIAVALYGSFIASNMSGMFTAKKKNINQRYSPEEKKEKERLTIHKLAEGWFTIFAAGIIIVVSILVYRL